MEDPRYTPRKHDENRLTRTYRLTPDLVRRIDQLAAELECWPSPLVDLLLAAALDELDAGQLHVNRTPIMYDISLTR